MPYITVFAVAFAVSLVVTPIARRLSVRWGIEAILIVRAVPKLGGLPIMVAYIAGLALVYLLLPPAGNDALRLRGVVVGSLVLLLGGLIDDRWDLSPWAQFAIQIGGTLIAVSHIIFIEVFTNPLSGDEVWLPSRLLAVLVTVIWIVGMINTVNWLDGLPRCCLPGIATGLDKWPWRPFHWRLRGLC